MGQSSSWNLHRRSLQSSSWVAEGEGLNSSIYLSVPCLKTGTKQRSGVGCLRDLKTKQLWGTDPRGCVKPVSVLQLFEICLFPRRMYNIVLWMYLSSQAFIQL